MSHNTEIEQGAEAQRRARVDEVLHIQDDQWDRGKEVLVEVIVQQHPWLADDAEALLDLIDNELRLRSERGAALVLTEYQARFPTLHTELAIQFVLHQNVIVQHRSEQDIHDSMAEVASRNTTEARADETFVISANPTPDSPNLTTTPGELQERSLPTHRQLGSYRLLNPLGQGAMGTVYLAEDLVLKRQVALKVLHPAIAADRAARQRFLREAQVAAALEDEHVVRVYQVGEDHGTPFLAMQLLEGESLDECLRRERKLVWSEGVRITRDAASGLIAAHQRGMLHRDIKPANLWLDRARRRVIVLDFGLAQLIDNPQFLTAVGMVVGTPAYMSPEQATGKELDPRSDLFSLAAVHYQMVTGQLPFPHTNVLALLAAIANETPRSPHDVDTSISVAHSDWIMEALRKQADKRPSSVEAWLRRLDELDEAGSRNSDSSSAVTVNSTRADHNSQARSTLLAVAGILLLALCVITIKITSTNGTTTELRTDNAATISISRTPDEYEAQEKRTAPAVASTTVTRAEMNPIPLSPAKSIPAAPPVIDPRETTPPLSAWSLVSAPVKIPGIKSWTVETRTYRGGALWTSFHLKRQLLAVGCADGTLRVWNTQTGELLKILVGHDALIVNCQFSADGKRLASCGDDNMVRLWDVDTGAMRQAIQTFGPRHALFSNDPRLLVIVTLDSAVIWDLSTVQKRLTLTHKDSSFYTAVLSPDNSVLMCGTGDGHCVSWSFPEGTPRPSIQASTLPVRQIAFSPNGKLMASLHIGGTEMSIFDSQTMARLQTIDKVDRSTGVGSFSWSSDGKSIVVYCSDSGLVEWIPLNDPSQRRSATCSPWMLCQPELADDGKSCVIPSHHRELWTWSLEKARADVQQSTEVKPTEIIAMAISDRQQRLAFVTPDGVVRISDNRPGAITEIVRPPLLHENLQIAWSPDGRELAIAGNADVVQIWNDVERRLTRVFSSPVTQALSLVAWSPDGRYVAAAGPACKHLCIWEASAGQFVRSVAQAKSASLSWAPGPRLAAINAERNGIWQADPEQPDLLNRKPYPDNKCLNLAWSSQQTLALCNGKAEVQILSDSGDLVRTIVTRNEIKNVAWSADGQRLACYSFVSPTSLGIEIWDRQTSELLQRWDACSVFHRDHIPISWTADGRYLVTTTDNSGIRIWDPKTTRCRANVVALERGDLIVSDHGNYVAPPAIESEIIYVVETEAGQSIMTPAEFTKQFGWKNDPLQVRLFDE